MSENYKNDHMIEVRASNIDDTCQLEWGYSCHGQTFHFKIESVWNRSKGAGSMAKSYQTNSDLPECHYAITCS